MCGGDVVQGGVEPLDRAHHASVVNLAEECHLSRKYYQSILNTLHPTQGGRLSFKRKQAGAELGQAQLQLELGFSLIKVCCISLMITN